MTCKDKLFLVLHLKVFISETMYLHFYKPLLPQSIVHCIGDCLRVATVDEVVLFADVAATPPEAFSCTIHIVRAVTTLGKLSVCVTTLTTPCPLLIK